MSLYPSFAVLLVDDDETLLDTLSEMLRSAGINHLLARATADDLPSVVRKHEVGVVLLDLALRGTPGQEALIALRAAMPEVPVIVVTGNGEIATAVACMKQGAFDYLLKPIAKADLIAAAGRAIEVVDLRRENRLLSGLLRREEQAVPQAFATTVTREPRMIALLQYAGAVARTGHEVLITGETGSGKELIARSIHDSSGRTGQFVPVNVAGLDDAVFADSLFGHVKGAYTGADGARRGLVDNAADGTLFLDEIGDLSLSSQVKLLRLAEAREYLPLGAETQRRCSARLVVATNRDLEAAVAAGTFRSDLYYRLSMHRVHLPPLRERLGDLEALVATFVAAAAVESETRPPHVKGDALDLLRGHSFPGNVRELRSVIFDAMSLDPAAELTAERVGQALERQSIRRIDNAPHPIRFPTQLPTIREAVEALLDEALARSKGNQTAAARVLGVSQPALSKRLRKRRG